MATLIAPANHSPHEDAEALRKAVKGWGANEKAIIAILGHRNAHQRQQIRRVYDELYQEDLIKRLESELSGHFERAVYRWMLEPTDRDALLANIAIRHIKTDYNVIVEFACVSSPEELLVLRRAYHHRHKRSMEEDVAASTTGPLRELLVGLVSSFRYDGNEINASLAEAEANILHDALRDKTEKREEVIRILSTRSKTQLIATFNRYKDLHGTSITKKWLEEASDEYHKALNSAISCIDDHKKYFEKLLHNAIFKKVGEDEDALTRVVVTRAERDLKDIKDLYYKRNSVSIEHDVSNELSGDYKKFILTLLGKEN
ncbi:hypothetical protein L6164_017873 [Bauhinia variegata]|uniref:Uncharacterized protein n=1 Tax=Bauhinia variegata TaxID=167791 RepID=A0ACB9NCU1_BAUVA|nr:hypothetical protein L6164_017873 [Bauhinia variegata]